MNYTKPEVISLASANSAIQGQQSKPINTVADLHLQPFQRTVAAYESDE